jgi:hypothetical protein
MLKKLQKIIDKKCPFYSKEPIYKILNEINIDENGFVTGTPIYMDLQCSLKVNFITIDNLGILVLCIDEETNKAYNFYL